MAAIKGFEVSGTIYENEDETARTNAQSNTSKIGDLADLETTEKTSVVGALNEVLETVGETVTILKTVSPYYFDSPTDVKSILSSNGYDLEDFDTIFIGGQRSGTITGGVVIRRQNSPDTKALEISGLASGEFVWSTGILTARFAVSMITLSKSTSKDKFISI